MGNKGLLTFMREILLGLDDLRTEKGLPYMTMDNILFRYEVFSETSKSRTQDVVELMGIPPYGIGWLAVNKPKDENGGEYEDLLKKTMVWQTFAGITAAEELRDPVYWMDALDEAFEYGVVSFDTIRYLMRNKRNADYKRRKGY